MLYIKFYLGLLFTVCCLVNSAQTDNYLLEMQQYQDTLNAEFRNPETSPLKEEDLSSFTGLDFFPVDRRYNIMAKLKRTPKSRIFKMKTTTSRTSLSSKYADLTFAIDGKEYTLEIYQNHTLIQTEEYADYLFLPFLDETNGEETYGGGRYIGLYIPEGDSVNIDFNKAYNPYCAYNEKYSCPIVPRSNRLKTEIRAGVRSFKKN